MLSQLPPGRMRWALVSAIVGAAALLRGCGVSAGAPFRMGVDEPVIFEVALRMMRSGDFNPRFYDYGGLTLYLQMAVGCVTFLAGAMARAWASLDQVWIGDLLVNGRLVNVALGTATVALVYVVGRRWGTSVGLLALFAMAVQPQHVRESHYALTDVPLTFLITLTLWLSIRAGESTRARVFFFAGLAAGAAAATKYHGVLALLMPLAVAAAGPVAGAVGRGAAALAGMVVGFLLGAPYSLLDLPGFLNGFAELMQHYNARRSAADTVVTYLKYMRGWFAAPPFVSVHLGWIGLGLSIAGLLLSQRYLRDRVLRGPTLALTLFPIAFLWFISNQGALQYGRYAMPITPMLSVFLAIAIVHVQRALRGSASPARQIGAALPVLVLVPPLIASVNWNLSERRVTTVDQVGHWIVTTVRPDERLVLGTDGLQLPPRLQVERARRVVGETAAAYRARGVVYLVASSAETDAYANAPTLLQAYTQLTRDARIVNVFPSSREHPGPTLTILKLD